MVSILLYQKGDVPMDERNGRFSFKKENHKNEEGIISRWSLLYWLYRFPSLRLNHPTIHRFSEPVLFPCFLDITKVNSAFYSPRFQVFRMIDFDIKPATRSRRSSKLGSFKLRSRSFFIYGFRLSKPSNVKLFSICFSKVAIST